MTEQLPIDVATAETVRFVREHCQAGDSILEIGCGAGYVAAELQRLGHGVMAIDADAEAVEAARARGVNAIVGEWPHVEVPSADVILFTRSLHHIHDLAGALDAARGARRVLIEDFDFPAAREASMAWLVTKVREGIARGFVDASRDEFANRVAAANDVVSAWRADHDHDLHGADTILEALAARFEVERRSVAPYLYRYLIPVAVETPEAGDWLRRVLEEERTTAQLIGRRFVAKAA